MNTYSLTSTKFTGEVMFKYNLNEDLIYFEYKAQMTQEQMDYLLTHLPLTLNNMKLMVKNSKNMIMTEIPEDLSFDRFWIKYNYKHGSKTRAEKLWNGMKDTDKYSCFMSIDRYNAWLNRKKNMEKVYPETYLNQRRYESDFSQ